MAGPGTDSTRSAADGAPSEARARERMNLIEEIYRASVASDYVTADPDRPARPSRRRQRAVVTFVGLGMAGVIIALGFSARILNAPVVTEQRTALRERIQAADTLGAQLTAQVTALRAEIQKARQADLETTAAGSLVAAQIGRYEVIAGFTPVTGGGAVVTLTDAKNPTTDDADVSRVLDSDVQEAVNGLWEAGAEAIAVNSQRLTSRSAIRSAAGAILVNYRPLQPPYVVDAIGPPDLAQTFKQTASAQALSSVARRFGIGFDTGSADDLRLPAATVSLPEQAKNIPDEGEATK